MGSGFIGLFYRHEWKFGQCKQLPSWVTGILQILSSVCLVSSPSLPWLSSVQTLQVWVCMFESIRMNMNHRCVPFLVMIWLATGNLIETCTCPASDVHKTSVLSAPVQLILCTETAIISCFSCMMLFLLRCYQSYHQTIQVCLLQIYLYESQQR